MAYITSAVRAVKFNGEAPDSPVLTLYRRWSAHHDRQRATTAREKGSWESLSSKGKWLSWSQVEEVVRQQRTAYEDATTSLDRAREGVRYAVLLFYSVLPPGRSLEYRTLTYKYVPRRHLYPSVPTPSDESENVLFLADDGSDVGGLYLGSFKNKRSTGAQKLRLDDKFDYFLSFIRRYVNKLRPRLLQQQTSAAARQHSFLFVVSLVSASRTDPTAVRVHALWPPPPTSPQDTAGQSFEDDVNSARWNQFIVTTTRRRANGIGIGPSLLRSSFVTHMMDSKGRRFTNRMKEQFAAAMRHSVAYVSSNN